MRGEARQREEVGVGWREGGRIQSEQASLRR